MDYPRKCFLFDCFSPDCGAALITAVAEAMSEGLNADQMNVLGTFLTAVADTISYMAAQRQRNEQVCPKINVYNTDGNADKNKTDDISNGTKEGNGNSKQNLKSEDEGFPQGGDDSDE